MKLNRWLMTSALVISAKSFAGMAPVPVGQDEGQAQQDQLGDQVIQDIDVNSLVDELRRKCEVYEQHDQIYPFKIRVNFKGRFVTVTKKPFCATFENGGLVNRKLTMKYNRFCTPDEQSVLSQASQLQVDCHQYFAQKFESLQDSPLLSFELASCSEINVDTIRQQTINQLSEMINSESGSLFIAGSEQMLYDSCSQFQQFASVQAGACQERAQQQQ